MSAKQAVENKKETSKETRIKEIALKLTQAFPELKENLGEKKFEKRIKKAAKLLGEGIKPAGPKKEATAKPKENKTKAIKPISPSPVKKTAKAAIAK